MDDITNPKRSLKEIFPGAKGKKAEINLRTEEEGEMTPPYVQRENRNFNPPTNFSPNPKRASVAKLLILVFIISSLVLAGFAASSSFSKAIVKITPNNQKMAISGSYEATSQGEGLRFHTVSGIEASEKKTIPASGTEEVQRKARGRIIVYNNFNTSPQTLVKTTRFEAPDGKIYRILEDISVPGQSKNAKGETVPGSIEVTVEADKAGPTYNMGLADFTIPGFKGGPRFEKFYARSKTPMEGGFAGQVPKISEADKAKVKGELEQSLIAKVNENLKAKIPEDVVLFPEATIIKFEEEVGETSPSANQAEITIKAVASAILFKKSELASFLAQRMTTEYKSGQEVDMADWQVLKFSLTDKDKITDPSSLSTIKFNLEGNTVLVWKFNENELKEKLRRADSKTYKNVLFQFPIQVASINFRPPWIRTIPADTNRIQIDLESPTAQAN